VLLISTSSIEPVSMPPLNISFLDYEFTLEKTFLGKDKISLDGKVIFEGKLQDGDQNKIQVADKIFGFQPLKTPLLGTTGYEVTAVKDGGEVTQCFDMQGNSTSKSKQQNALPVFFCAMLGAAIVGVGGVILIRMSGVNSAGHGMGGILSSVVVGAIGAPIGIAIGAAVGNALFNKS